MNALEILRTNRRILTDIVTGLTEEQIEIIPQGFNNNILWNVLHVIVSQQILHYKLSGLDLLVDNDIVESCRKGTSPANWQSTPSLKKHFNLLAELPDALEQDYNSNKFENFQTYMTSTGFELKNIDDAIQFNNFHEGIHTGVILALRKFV